MFATRCCKSNQARKWVFDMRFINIEWLLGISVAVIVVIGVIYLRSLPEGEPDGSAESSLDKAQKRAVDSRIRQGSHKRSSVSKVNAAKNDKRVEEQSKQGASGISQKVGAVKNQTHEKDLSTSDAEKESRDPAKALKDWSVQLESYCGEAGVDKVVTTEDQVAVVDVFNKLDSTQQLEQIRQAMNMLPDKTVQVVFGILFDNTQPEEVVDVIFSDLLNRNEAIKNPVMEQIVKDKKHPMYFESARILDVIGLH
jgi:hypothetical protein